MTRPVLTAGRHGREHQTRWRPVLTTALNEGARSSGIVAGGCRSGGGDFVAVVRAGQGPAPDDERSDGHAAVPARALQGR